jgi:ribosomal protein S18 acetylase RimI-like enzyme
MAEATLIRPAAPDDSALIGAMLVEAGGGVFEVLLEGLVPDVTPAQMLAQMARDEEGPFSYRQTRVAEVAGTPAGILMTFPAVWFDQPPPQTIPAERHVYLNTMRSILDRESFYVAALAIAPAFRRRGLGGLLLAEAFEQTRAAAFPRTTLHVWAGNSSALALYLRLGFVETMSARVPPHPGLHHGTSLLTLSRPV